MKKWTPKILIVSVVKKIDFQPQTASKTSFREPSPAISHLLKFALRLEKREHTLKVSIKSLTDKTSLRKKVESSAKVVYKKAWLKIVISLMSALLLINSQRTSKASIKTYDGMG